MTAKTSQHLADVLRAAGFDDLAFRAEQDEFHDFFSPHGFPEIRLADELLDLMSRDSTSQPQRIAAHHIRMRLIDGEFDASVEESDEWAAGPEGQAAADALLKGT